MGLSKEELNALIAEKDPAAKFVIRTPEEEQTFLENYRSSEVEKALGTKISEVHTRYDDDIFAVTGLKKKPEEKTYEFNKRVLSELKGKGEKAAEYEAEIVRLNEAVKKGGGEKLAADLENVRNEYAKFKTEKEIEFEKLKKDNADFKKRTKLDSKLNAFEFDTSIPESVRKVVIAQQIEALLSISDLQNDELIFLDEKGAPLRNKDNNLAPYTAEEILSERLKDIIKKKRTLPGTKVPDASRKTNMNLPEGVKTKVQLGDWLIKEGIKRGTKEYDEAFAELGEGLPLR